MTGDQETERDTVALEAVLVAVLAPLGLNLYDVERRAERLVVTLDAPVGGLDLDAVAEAAKAVSAAFDAHDELVGEGPYELEVTTPGLERQLRRKAHFAGATGSMIALRLRHPIDGARRFEGRLARVGDDGVELVAADGAHELPFAAIERAHTIFDWKAALAAKRAEPADSSPPDGPLTAGSGRASMKERR